MADAAPQSLHDLEVLFITDRHDLLDAQRRGILGRGDPCGQVAAKLGPEVADLVNCIEDHSVAER